MIRTELLDPTTGERIGGVTADGDVVEGWGVGLALVPTTENEEMLRARIGSGNQVYVLHEVE